jgi:hypothetical protein
LQAVKGDGYLNEECSEPKPYICERKTGISFNILLFAENINRIYHTKKFKFEGQSSYCDLDNGWDNVNNACVKVFQIKSTWADARFVFFFTRAAKINFPPFLY